MVNIVGVRFKKASKVYDFDANSLELALGEEVIVEVERGLGMGTVVNRPREVDPATVLRQLKKVVRKADAVDQERHGFNLEREKEAFDIWREKIDGRGPCGRELCCSGFLSDFEPVTIKMAKEQGLALNPVKISGICGRLMCCLSYEHEFYQGEKAERRERAKGE